MNTKNTQPLDAEEEKWYFSVVDIIEVLSDTDRPGKYWSNLKARLKTEVYHV